MLEKYYDVKEMAKVLLPRKDYKPFPKYEDREAWANVYAPMRKDFLDENFKKTRLEFDTSALTASAYMEWYRTNGETDGKWSRITQCRRDYLWDCTLA